MIEPKPRRSKPNRLRYRVLGQIGRGGMADVHLALAEGPGGFSKLVVLKQLRKQQGQDQEQDEDLDQSQEHDQFELFSDEARIAGRLSHPNVVQTIEETEAGGAPMLVMEYLEGQPLSSILRKCTGERRVEDVPILLRIVAEALQGLHYAHELRDFDGKPLALVHRDVSPQNIFVTYGGEVKVLDFGIAKAT
ncbi:MAG TPA: serine/threonine-protein kinase, partial [Polyangiaceae bacterium]|nr:serine/threonine-protein kinase [Polyangiaceae bacterium]